MTLTNDSLVSKRSIPSMEDLFFLEADAVRIGNMIVNNAEDLLCPEATDSKYPLSFSDGASGIILFLLELYRQTGDSNYLAAAHFGVRNLVNLNNRSKTLDYSFFKGELGIAYTLLQFYKATNDQESLDKAVAIAKKSADDFLHYPYTANSFFNGRSGSLMVLVHLHSATHDRSLLDLINLFINKIIQGAQHGNLGLYWSNFNSTSHGQCGLLHGSSGVGYTLLEAGHYFQNEAFYAIAEQAFSFEDYHWDLKLKNWPDYKLDISNASDYLHQKYQYNQGNLKFFQGANNTISYARGTAGIGLARNRAFQLLKSPAFGVDVDTAFQIIERSYREISTHSVYDGTIGCAMFCLEAYRTTQLPKYLDFAKEVSLNIHRQVDFEKLQLRTVNLNQPTDFSLLNGLAGIGYFALQLLDPMNTPSIVLPTLDSTIDKNIQTDAYPFIDLNAAEIKRILLRKVFGRTIYLIENVAMYQLKRYLGQPQKCLDEKMEFQIFVENLIPQLESKHSRIIKNIFELELRKSNMANSIDNGALVHMGEIFHAEEVERIFAMEDADFLSLQVSVNSEVEIVNTFCDPKLNTDTAFVDTTIDEDKTYQTLLKPTTQQFFNTELRKTCHEFYPRFNRGHVMEVVLSELQCKLLSTLDVPRQVREIVAEMTALDVADESDASDVKEIVCKQIKDDLLLGILKPSYSTELVSASPLDAHATSLSQSSQACCEPRL
jgi:hypothetical protein